MIREFKVVMVVLFALSGVALSEEVSDDAPKAAKAAKGKNSPEELFKQFDGDGDGTVTLEEFTAQRKVIAEKRAKAKGKPAPKVKEEHFKKAFDLFDGDESGDISEEEFVNHIKEQQKAAKLRATKKKATKKKAAKKKGGKRKAAKQKGGKQKAAAAE